MISVIRREALIVGFQFSKSGCCNPTAIPKKLHHGYFCRLANFFRIDITQEIAQKILNTKVKQVLQRRGGGRGVAMELQRKLK